MLEIIGLVLNAVGAILLAKSADIQGNIIAEIVAYIIPGYGRYDAPQVSKEKEEQFARKRTLSRTMNQWGYILFILGFTLQIIGVSEKG